jgi:hypothetical protein
MAEQKITPEVVRARAAASGVTLKEEWIEDIAKSMDSALGSIRDLNLREIRQVQPAIIFDPRWSE